MRMSNIADERAAGRDDTTGGPEAEIALRDFCFETDFQPVLHLWETAGPGVHLGRSDTADEIRKKLERDPDLFLVATHGDKIVGTVLGGFDGRRGMVYHLAVAQAYRRRGLARRLMSALEDRLRRKGCLRSYLLVTFDNEEAQRLYESTGWKRMDIHIYGKDLD